MTGERRTAEIARKPGRRRKPTPKAFSAYLVTWSDESSMPVGSVLIDKGTQIDRDWNVMNFETGVETGARGRRLARLCPDCRVNHSKIGILGHDGECGSDEVKDEARQELKHAEKRIEAADRG